MDHYQVKRYWNEPDAIYPSVITKDGVLTLPEECLTDKIRAGEDAEPVVITNFLDEGVLCLYSADDFDSVKSQIDCLNSLDPNVRKLKRGIIGESVEIRINEDRQINVSPELMMRLGFDPNQTDEAKQTSFPVMLLVYPTRVLIASTIAYERIMKELEE